jgi:CheY-like chemotaxis protein
MGGVGPLVISAREVGSAALPHDHFVCLSVEDSGAGMDEATLKRATEPFFTTKGVGKGTGLGLSMVQGLAEQSGGKLTLISKPGVGTIAELSLRATDARRIVPKAAPTVRSQAVTQKPLDVLLVDDDPLVLSNTAAMLEDLGHRVVTAPSGDAALKLLATQRVDLLLTDHAMPHMTGAQLVSAVRVQQQLPVIIATGFAELPEDVSAMTRLRKPYSQADLLEAINRAQAEPENPPGAS